MLTFMIDMVMQHQMVVEVTSRHHGDHYIYIYLYRKRKKRGYWILMHILLLGKTNKIKETAGNLCCLTCFP